MPVDFLTSAQRERFGRYPASLAAEELARFFHLDDDDREWIAGKRRDSTRLGFALQITTVRFLGTFLADPTAVPPTVLSVVATQIGVADPLCVAAYRDSEQRWRHAAEIRARYGYREFMDRGVRFRLGRWLCALCWTGTDRPGVLFDHARGWLIGQKILLPGVSVLERFISEIRSRMEARLWRMLVRDITGEQRHRFDELLTPAGDSRQSHLDQLRKGPVRISGPALAHALLRIETVRGLGIRLPAIRHVPNSRIAALARFANTAKVSAVARLPADRRIATLVAFVHTLEASAQDDALDILDALLRGLFAKAQQSDRKARLRTLKDLDEAAMILADACHMLLDGNLPGSDTNPHKERLAGGFAGPQIRDRFLNRESDSGGREMAAPVKVTREEHTAQDLRRLAADLKDAGHARRLQAISFVLDGWSRNEAAAFADVDRQTLRDWVERYNEGGASALATLTSPGRPRLLTPNQGEELYQIVVKGPDLNKDGVIRWRCEDLVQQAVSRFGVPEVHPSTMAKWLHRLRLTKLTARPFHPRKDEAAQQAFKENFSTIVNEKLPAAVKDNGIPIEFWFQDEARVGQQGTLSRVWAPVGSCPAMVRDNRRANAYIYGAICPGRGIGAALVMASANTEAMNEHLKEISVQVATGAHAALLCDGAGWHEKSKELVVPGNITLITLPPYSPELNPMENVWEFLRDNRFGAQVWKTYGAIVHACSKAWNWFVSDPLRIASIGTREWVIL